jgi:phosphoenolpyruvate---glycerone phosphotransferase subunit DhaL
MIAAVGWQEWRAMLTGVVAQIESSHPWLSELDSTCGDGDHGTTMLRAANAIEKCVAKPVRPVQDLLSDVAWAFMGLDGGATGPLLGSFFLGLSEATGSKDELDAHSLAEAFDAGLATLAQQTRAQVGDKTMMDAFLPAIQAMRQAAQTSQDIGQMLSAAATAASEGAASTKNYVAKAGRAKYLGEKTLGTQDPGATSVSLLFRGLCEGLRQVDLQRTGDVGSVERRSQRR